MEGIYTGYVEELPCSFGVLSVFGIGYSICSAPTAMILSFCLKLAVVVNRPLYGVKS